MKIDFPKRYLGHIMNFMKLGYILIIVGATYLLRLYISPATMQDFVIRGSLTGYMIECIVIASTMLTAGSLYLQRFF
ncbi:MAG: hypothetical protein IJZ93_04610 [Clostridia bacterium]|nr:hypothetical protein [Clostridia bacterium]